MPDYAWDILKYKFALKILNLNSTFLMVFGGSSVTAGHDNFYSQAYPFVIERRMKPIFAALGVDLLIHNIAMGANQCRPYNYCYEAQGGSSPDWISWEQSFNCGKDRSVFELIARYAVQHRAVMYYIASGGFSPKECPKSNSSFPWINEQWQPSDSGITSTYLPNQKRINDLKAQLHLWNEAGDSSGRFSSPLGGMYKMVGPHGYSVWTSYKTVCWNYWNNLTGCNAIDMKGSCYQYGGPHWMVEEASWYGSGGRGKSWHPSVGMHLLRGETLAYNYIHILLDAMNMIEHNSSVASKDRLIEGVTA